MNPWTDLCQWNVNHHNDNPKSHAIIPAVGVVIAVVVLNVLAYRAHRKEMAQKGITI